MSLQALLVIVFAITAGFMFWASGYVQSSVHDQLVAQQIVFPTKNSASLQALPAADRSAMSQYAGDVMSNGNEAETYANHFIKVHLGEMGMTYSQISARLLAHPNNTTLQQLSETIFKGTTLRGMLLNAYGWWTIGTYTGLGALAALLAALAVFGAFVFEVIIALREKSASAVGAVRRQPSASVGSPA